MERSTRKWQTKERKDSQKPNLFRSILSHLLKIWKRSVSFVLGVMSMSDEPDNSAIRALRTQIQTLETALTEKSTTETSLQTQLAEAQTKLTAAERAKLDEMERLKLELEDHKTKLTTLEQVQQQNTTLLNTINAQIEAQITALPEANQATVRDLLTAASPEAKLDQLQKIIKLGNLAAPVTTPVTSPAGTPPIGVTPPGTPPPPGTVTYDPKNLPGWTEVLNAPKP